MNQFTELNDRIDGLLDGCEVKLKNFLVEHESMREAIVNLDESLSVKASKINIVEIREWSLKEFVKAADNIKLHKGVTELKQKIEEQVSSLINDFD